MHKRITLRFDWPNINIDEFSRVVKGYGKISNEHSYLKWELPLECLNGISEVIVRQAEYPLKEDNSSGAIYVRELGDLRQITSVINGGGLHRLICTKSATSILDSIDARLEKFQRRLSRGKQVYIFAAHRNAVKCVRYCKIIGLDVIAFIDNDKNKQGRVYHGYPIVSLESVEKNSTIINASGRYCVEINEQLSQAGYRSCIDMMELLYTKDLQFQAELGFRKYVSDIVENRLRIASFYVLLADDMSRLVLDRLLEFRLTMDSKLTKEITSPYREEFFAEDILSFSTGEVFVDGGAFDGDSFQRFAEMAPEFTRAYLFEPDCAIWNKAKTRLGDDSRVSICNNGLWSKTTDLRFSSTGGMDGAVCEDGDIHIKVVSVDEFIKGKVTHIKLDVEGAEEKALLGAQDHISKYRPKMAVALYHRAADLWKLPSMMDGLGGHYSFSLRHYSQTIDDTIVYALPRY